MQMVENAGLSTGMDAVPHSSGQSGQDTACEAVHAGRWAKQHANPVSSGITVDMALANAIYDDLRLAGPNAMPELASLTGEGTSR